MNYIKTKTFYKIDGYGHIRPTKLGYFCLLGWIYFIIRIIFICTLPDVSSYDEKDSYIIPVIGGITVLIGSWLIFTILSYTCTLRRLFRSLATTMWMSAIEEGKLPPPPVRKVTYNYSEWTSTLTYQDKKTFKATFYITFDENGLHQEKQPEIQTN